MWPSASLEDRQSNNDRKGFHTGGWILSLFFIEEELRQKAGTSNHKYVSETASQSFLGSRMSFITVWLTLLD